MFPCGDSRLRAWISLRLLTWSRESKWFFMHLIATYFPFLMHCAFSTSENVPSPFLATRRYSAADDGWGENQIPDLGRKLRFFRVGAEVGPRAPWSPWARFGVGLKRLGIAIDRPDRWGGSEALDRVPPRVHGPDRGAWASHDPMVPKEALRG